MSPWLVGALCLASADPASALPTAGDNDGVCSQDEALLGHCLETPAGWVVEVVTGAMGEFPVLTPEGNSQFSYLITGPGAGDGCNAVSHADIQIPVCVDNPLVIVSTDPRDTELLTNGQGDPSCGFGEGDLEHDVLKWNTSVPCDGSLTVTVVFEGIIGAELQEFLLKNGQDCQSASILGPSCTEEVGQDYCFGLNCPCGNDDPNAGCANSSGSGGLLTAAGSTSIMANDLTMTATNLIPGQTAALFSADNALNGGNGRVFGDGLRCAGVNLERLNIGAADGMGTFTTGPGVIGLESNPVVGQTRRMQVWYRDPMGGPCNSGHNLTNGVSLLYAP